MSVCLSVCQRKLKIDATIANVKDEKVTGPHQLPGTSLINILYSNMMNLLHWALYQQNKITEKVMLGMASATFGTTLTIASLQQCMYRLMSIGSARISTFANCVSRKWQTWTVLHSATFCCICTE